MEKFQENRTMDSWLGTDTSREKKGLSRSLRSQLRSQLCSRLCSQRRDRPLAQNVKCRKQLTCGAAAGNQQELLQTRRRNWPPFFASSDYFADDFQ
jgi:hypothetical protein